LGESSDSSQHSDSEASVTHEAAAGVLTGLRGLQAALRGAEHLPSFGTIVDCATTFYGMHESSSWKGAFALSLGFAHRNFKSNPTVLTELAELGELAPGEESLFQAACQALEEEASFEVNADEQYVEGLGIVRLADPAIGEKLARLRKPKITEAEFRARIAAIEAVDKQVREGEIGARLGELRVRAIARAHSDGFLPKGTVPTASAPTAPPEVVYYPVFPDDCVAVARELPDPVEDAAAQGRIENLLVYLHAQRETLVDSWSSPLRPSGSALFRGILRNPVAAAVWAIFETTFTATLPDWLRAPLLFLAEKIGGGVGSVMRQIWDLVLYLRDLLCAFYYNKWDEFAQQFNTVASIHAACIALDVELRADDLTLTAEAAYARLGTLEKALTKLIRASNDRNNASLVSCHRALADLRTYIATNWAASTVSQAAMAHLVGPAGHGKTQFGQQLLSLLTRRYDESGEIVHPNRMYRLQQAKHQETFTPRCISIFIEDAFAVHPSRANGMENPLYLLMRLGDGTPVHFEHAHLELKAQGGAHIRYAIWTDNKEPCYEEWGSLDSQAPLRRFAYHVVFDQRPGGRPETPEQFDEVTASVWESDPNVPPGQHPRRRMIGRYARPELLKVMVTLMEKTRMLHERRHATVDNPVSCGRCLMPLASCLCERKCLDVPELVAASRELVVEDVASLACLLGVLGGFTAYVVGVPAVGVALLSAIFTLGFLSPWAAFKLGALLAAMRVKWRAGGFAGKVGAYYELSREMIAGFGDPRRFVDPLLRRGLDNVVATGDSARLTTARAAAAIRSVMEDPRFVAAIAIVTAAFVAYAVSSAMRPAAVAPPAPAAVASSGVFSSLFPLTNLAPPALPRKPPPESLMTAAYTVRDLLVRVYSPSDGSVAHAEGVVVAPHHVLTVAHFLDSRTAPPRVAFRPVSAPDEQARCTLVPRAAVHVDLRVDCAMLLDLSAVSPCPVPFVPPTWEPNVDHDAVVFSRFGQHPIYVRAYYSKNAMRYVRGDGEAYELPGGYAVRHRMEIGDCGTPLLALIDGEPRLLGIVCAISPASSGLNLTFVRPVPLEMLAWRSPDAPPNPPPVESYIAAARELSKQLLPGVIHPSSPWRDAADVGEVLGAISPRIGESGVSRMRPTPFAAEVRAVFLDAPHFVPPSPATQVVLTEGGRQFTGNYLVKRLTQARDCDSELWGIGDLDELIESVADRLYTAARKSSIPSDRPLNEFEAVNGVGDFKGIDMRTSAGAVPGWGLKSSHVVELPPAPSGKRLFALSAAMAEGVSNLRSTLLRGEMPAVYGMSTWKSNQAVAPGKAPRAIFWGPMTLLVAARMFLVAFIAAIKSDLSVCGCAVGVNAWDPREWQKLVDHLNSAPSPDGRLVYLDIDYEGYDARTTHDDYVVNLRVLRRVLERLGWTPAEVRAGIIVVWCYLRSPYVVRTEAVVMKTTTISGLLATSEWNSLLNWLKIIAAFRYVTGLSLIEVMHALRILVYGDDANVAFSEQWGVKYGVTPQALTDAFRLVGGRITDGVDKNLPPQFRSHAHELCFLKRSRRLVMRPSGLHLLAPLAVDSISRSLLVFEPSRTAPLCLQLGSLLLSAVQEAWQHGDPLFTQVRDLAVRLAQTHCPAQKFPTNAEMWHRVENNELMAPWISGEVGEDAFLGDD